MPQVPTLLRYRIILAIYNNLKYDTVFNHACFTTIRLKVEMKDDPSLQRIHRRIRKLCDGAVEHDIESVTAKGIQLLQASNGFLLCSYIIHKPVLDENGNWQTGSIATMIDIIGSLAVHSVTPMFNVSVDFNMSFYSTAKFQEEVEIEAKVVGKKEKLTSVVVDIRKKNNGQIIAMGKQWMSSTNINSNRYQTSKL
ncbi:putative acyl-CoA hydrolase [Lupinus albus]|uniref:Acyl-coenzyme A thioesterase 13 n=1 Tax=Lupinus albus TaxID=3870 RepID=A0A6A4MQ16_LUPAL|nr:putative acyl-CoA hydrolase [Lupinus albus]